MKVLGIDYGEAKVGIAIGESETKTAHPFKVIKNSGWHDLFVEIKLFCEKQEIEKIVVGLPINGHGRESQQLERVKSFISNLKSSVDLPVESYDERFTTQAASRISSRKKEDAVAAMFILEGYFDQPS